MKAVGNFSDTAWLSQLRHDDGSGFDALFRHYSPRVYRFAYSYLKSRVAAEEIVQECFLKIWEKRYQLRDDVPLKGYLFTTAHHLILNQLRHAQHQGDYQDFLRHAPLAEGNTEKEVEYAELEKVYLAALAKLPPKRRRIFTLSRQQGLSYAEIAQEMGISVKTVETQMAQALKFLRVYFKLHGNVLTILPLLISIKLF